MIAAVMGLISYIAFLLFLTFAPNSVHTPLGDFLALDFLSFWSAADLAISGNSLLPFQTQVFLDHQETITGQERAFAFFYPPTWLSAVLPLGLLPFKAAYLLFNAIGFVVLFLAGRLILGDNKQALILCAFPAAMNCMMHGQNAFISAALLGAALGCNQYRRYVLAGVFIGLLSFKPQLGLIIPLALVFSRNWQTFVAAAATTLLMGLQSWLMFGTETWVAFFEQLPIANHVLKEGHVEWEKMVSIYAAMRVFGLEDRAAFIIQLIAAAGILFLLFKSWTAQRSMAQMSAVLVGGGLLSTPFALSYDLLILAIPIAFIVSEALENQFLTWEKSTLALIVLLSAATSVSALRIGIPVAPLLPIAVIWLGWRRGQVSELIDA